MTSPIGLYGGTFDPVHFGHLRLATEMREALLLERVVFLPAGNPWQRERATFANGAERARMLALALAGERAFGIDERELRRPGPSYTADTLAEIRRELGAEASLVFLCGTDAFAQIETWHRWEELFDLAHFAVAVRAGDPEWQSKGLAAMPAALRARVTTNVGDIHAAPAGHIMAFPMTPLAISSTAMRALLQARASIRYLTPDPVVDHIHQHSLYGTAA